MRIPELEFGNRAANRYAPVVIEEHRKGVMRERRCRQQQRGCSQQVSMRDQPLHWLAAEGILEVHVYSPHKWIEPILDDR